MFVSPLPAENNSEIQIKYLYVTVQNYSVISIYFGNDVKELHFSVTMMPVSQKSLSSI